MTESETFWLGDKVLENLKRKLVLEEDDFVARKVALKWRDPFKIIVAIILSQNTIEKNTLKAYMKLEKNVGISPNAISSTSPEKIKNLIRIAGLQESKARAIKELARIIVERFNGKPEKLLKMGEEEIRELLNSIPGIGRKTIDVFLANFGYPVLPIDVHIRRVSLRLGLAKSKSYEKMQRELHKVFRPEKRLNAHMYLIKLGRTYCKALKPNCKHCPLNSICPKIIE